MKSASFTAILLTLSTDLFASGSTGGIGGGGIIADPILMRDHILFGPLGVLRPDLRASAAADHVREEIRKESEKEKQEDTKPTSQDTPAK